MQVRQDKYSLTKSPTIKILENGDDIKVDLKLSLNTKIDNIGAVISGMVVDSNNSPIKGAIIKLMNDKLKPLLYVETDSSGQYILENIPLSSTYNIVATATGKLLTAVLSFKLNANESIVKNFILSDDANATLGAISGTLLNTNNEPIFGAVVSLYYLVNNTSTLTAITYTDSLGGFILSELSPGNYNITISSLGYNTSQVTTSVESGKISSISTTITPATITSSGIISGIISDDIDVPIANADVILYNVNSDNTLSPVAYTTTNNLGVYTFINVPLGSYLVKSTQAQYVDISDANTSTFSNSTLPNGIYNVALGILSNGAKINEATNFVSLIGGPEDGSSTINNIIIPKSGVYDLSIKYLCSIDNKTFKVDINGIDSGILYTVEPTNSLSINHIKTFTLQATLNSGSNSIKFHGDGLNYSPDLEQIILNFNNTETLSNFQIMYSATNGKLSKDATLDIDSNLVTSLGGITDESVILQVPIPVTGTYYCAIAFRNTDTISRILNIDVNNISTSSNYNATPATLSLLSTELFLNAGINTIKFHGNGMNLAPDLGTIIFIPSQPDLNYPKILLPSTYLFVNGIFYNGAKLSLNKTYLTNINSKSTCVGGVTIIVIAPIQGYYNIEIKYINTDTSSSKELTISINNDYSTTISSIALANPGILNTTIPLKTGVNSILFSATVIANCPDLISFVLYNK